MARKTVNVKKGQPKRIKKVIELLSERVYNVKHCTGRKFFGADIKKSRTGRAKNATAVTGKNGKTEATSQRVKR